MNNLPSTVLDAPQTAIQLKGPPRFDCGTSYEHQQIRPSSLQRHNVASSSRGTQEINVTVFYTEQKRPLLDTSSLDKQLSDLQGVYTLLSEGSLITDVLAEVPPLYKLLKEALEPLQLAFGDRKLLQLGALRSDDDTVLRVMVKLPANTQQSAELMRKFKRNWWLKNCSRSNASLVFDYEIGNGF